MSAAEKRGTTFDTLRAVAACAAPGMRLRCARRRQRRSLRDPERAPLECGAIPFEQPQVSHGK